MNNDEKILTILAEMQKAQTEMQAEQRKTNERLDSIESTQAEMQKTQTEMQTELREVQTDMINLRAGQMRIATKVNGMDKKINTIQATLDKGVWADIERLDNRISALENKA